MNDYAANILIVERKALLERLASIDEALMLLFQQLKIEKKEPELKNHINELNDFEQLLKDRRNELSHNPAKQSSFNLDEAVLDAIAVQKRFLHVREIRNYVSEKHPIAGTYTNLLGSISQSLNRLKDKTNLTHCQIGDSNRNSFWGFSEWMENGEIMPKYDYNHNYLTSTAINSVNNFDLKKYQ